MDAVNNFTAQFDKHFEQDGEHVFQCTVVTMLMYMLDESDDPTGVAGLINRILDKGGVRYRLVEVN
jgi:hypothetical protein